MRLTDFAIVEFARAWQEEAGASVVDPDALEAARSRPAPDDDARLLAYADALLDLRVGEAEGRGALAQLRAALDAMHVAAPALGALAGASLLAATLPAPDARPVNVFVFLGEGVLLPALFGLVTMALSLGAGRVLARTHWLAWAMGWIARGALSTRLGRLTGRVLRTSGVTGPLFGSLSHLLWVGALSAFLLGAGWRFLFTDYLFAWSSTVPLTADGVHGVFSALAAPLGWLPGVHAPTPEQVSVSEWASLVEGWARSSGDPARDDALRKGWYALLLAGVGFWGLLPRIVALAATRAGLRRRVRGALRSPAHQAVLDAIAAPAMVAVQDGDGAGPSGSLLPPTARATPPSAPERRRPGLDVVTLAADPPGAGTLARLGLDRLGLSGVEHRIAEDDDDEAMEATLDALGAAGEGAGGAVVVFAVADSPGRLREAFLRDVVAAVAGGPVHVLLAGVDAFRRSPRGRMLPERIEAWREAAGRVGVPPERVHPDEEAP